MVRYLFSLIVVGLLLISCSSGSSREESDPSGFSLGTLPNGSSVWINSNSLSVNQAGTAASNIELRRGYSGHRYEITFKVSPSGPSITTTPNPCIMVSGTSQQTCKLAIAANNVAPGNYIVSVYYKDLASQDNVIPLPNTISLTITPSSNPEPTPGFLTLTTSESEIYASGSTTATVTLENSLGVIAPLNVAMVTTDNDIATVSPSTCFLTTQNNTCTATIDGIWPGNVNVIASAAGYITATTNLKVVNPPTLTLSPIGSDDTVKVGSSATTTITGSGIIDSLSLNVSMFDSSIASVSPSTCLLTTQQPTCTVTVTGIKAGLANLQLNNKYTTTERRFVVYQ
jgi:hypothetical protein